MELLNAANALIRRVLVARGARSAYSRIGEHLIHHYRLRGKGPGGPLLLVHGLGGSANGFHRILFRLARRFSEVWAVDLPGNGFSPLPPSGPLLVPQQLEVLIGFCRELLRRPAFVVGNSLGGAMCIALAQVAPEQVRALGLIAPAGARVSEQRFSELLRGMNPQTPSEARQLSERLFHRAPLLMLLLSGELLKMYGSPAVKHLFAHSHPSDHLQPEWLSSLAVPVLLIWGRSEKVLPYEGIDYFRAHLPPQAEIQVVDGFGHIPQMERPSELARRLVDFADRHRL
ncbi:MAG: alpha/beta fold hydrolase [Myxococcales bacterium]|nr:alpha/beta fold hydrolase [Myxococcales bacterium]